MRTIRAVPHHDGSALDQYAKVPIRVETDRVIRCVQIDRGAGGFRLEEMVIDPPFAVTFPGTEDEPFPRHRKWDASEWGVFVAADDDRVVGGCVVAVRTPQVRMLEGQTDLAVLGPPRGSNPERRRNRHGVVPDREAVRPRARLYHAEDRDAEREPHFQGS